MKIRSERLRLLAVLPVLVLGCLGLVGCDSKAGTAAVVDGHRITEQELSRYVPPNAQPIPGQNGASTPAKNFVLQFLVRNEVFPLLLAASGSPVTEAQLAAGRAQALQGTTEQELTQQIVASGLSERFQPVVLRNRQLIAVLQTRLTTDKQINDALAKIKDKKVSINPRYGSWDLGSLSLKDLSKKQLPSVLSFDQTLPGDVTQPTQQ